MGTFWCQRDGCALPWRWPRPTPRSALNWTDYSAAPGTRNWMRSAAAATARPYAGCTPPADPALHSATRTALRDEASRGGTIGGPRHHVYWPPRGDSAPARYRQIHPNVVATNSAPYANIVSTGHQGIGFGLLYSVIPPSRRISKFTWRVR